MVDIKRIKDYFNSLDMKKLDEGIPPMKMHALLYFAQGVNLAIYGVPLFGNGIRAKACGFVVSEEKTDITAFLTEVEGNLLQRIYNNYGQFSAWKLQEMVTKHRLWHRYVHTNSDIPIDEIKDYFRYINAY